MSSQATGARAAELEDLGGAVGGPFAGFQCQDQVIADDGRGVGPGGGDGAAQAFAVAGGTDSGHPDADAVGLGGELFADRGQQGGEFLAVEELEVAGADGEGSQDAVRAFDQQGRGARAAAFDA